jgi:hypothetical protein
MKALNTVLRVVLALLLVSPILGALGIFPAPTPDLYNTPEAFSFIDMIAKNGYIMYIMAIVFAVAIYLIIRNRMALAALLILPVVVNIIAFHLFLDGGLFTAGAIMANVLVLITGYFLWKNRSHYKNLCEAKGNSN